MILTSKGRYAVMAMVDIAINGSEGNPINLADISSRQEITVAYLEQIFSKLKKANLVKSVRGPGGGYLLSAESDEINIADIVLAVNEPIKITRCSKDGEGGCMTKKAKCATHDLWFKLTDHIEEFLRNTTVKDVCDKNIGSEFAAMTEASV